MHDLPRRIRLAPGDYFMHGQDWRMRGAGLPGNVCRVALTLKGALNAELLRERVAASPMLQWLVSLRIRRPFSLLPPLWCASAHARTVLHQHQEQNGGEPGSELLPGAVLGRDLDAGRGPALALDLVSHRDGTECLVLSWNHALVDARGGELILRHLNFGENCKGTPTLEDLIEAGQRRGGLSRWWHAMKSAHGSLEWLNQSGSEPLFTLLPRPSTSPIRTRQNRTRILSFDEAETACIGERCERLNAGFRRSHFYLAASIRALHAVASARGNRDAGYLVPVPHDMRRRGSSGPIFSNHLSILFYRIEPRQAVNLGEIVAELTRQMMDQIRTRFPEACMAALEMFKPLPLNLYARQLGKPTQGKFASFCFSDSGESCGGMPSMLGSQIQEVTHFVPTWRPPGLTVLFWSFRGRPRAQLSWVDDCMTLAEVDALEKGLRSALMEEPL